MMTADDARSGPRWHRGSVRGAYFPRCCSIKVFSAAILLVALERFSKDAGILADLIHLQEQPPKVGPETALECVQRAIWGILYADDTECRVL